MRNKILAAGIVCLSLIAAAQSNGSSGQSSSATKTTGPRETASGHASGRESSAPSVSEVVVSKPGDTRVATGDVNGDGKADVVAGSPTGNGQGASGGAAPALRESPSKASTGQTTVRESPTRHTLAVSASDGTATMVRESPTKASTGQTMVRESPTKASTGQTMVRESPTKASTGQNAAINNSHSNIKNSRDAATGQASGKRQ